MENAPEISSDSMIGNLSKDLCNNNYPFDLRISGGLVFLNLGPLHIRCILIGECKFLCYTVSVLKPFP